MTAHLVDGGLRHRCWNRVILFQIPFRELTYPILAKRKIIDSKVPWDEIWPLNPVGWAFWFGGGRAAWCWRIGWENCALSPTCQKQAIQGGLDSDTGAPSKGETIDCRDDRIYSDTPGNPRYTFCKMIQFPYTADWLSSLIYEFWYILIYNIYNKKRTHTYTDNYIIIYMYIYIHNLTGSVDTFQETLSPFSRLLRPGGRCVPRRLRLRAALLEAHLNAEHRVVRRPRWWNGSDLELQSWSYSVKMAT